MERWRMKSAPTRPNWFGSPCEHSIPSLCSKATRINFQTKLTRLNTRLEVSNLSTQTNQILGRFPHVHCLFNSRALNRKHWEYSAWPETIPSFALDFLLFQANSHKDFLSTKPNLSKIPKLQKMCETEKLGAFHFTKPNCKPHPQPNRAKTQWSVAVVFWWPSHPPKMPQPGTS